MPAATAPTIDRTTFRLPETCYFPDMRPKDLIVLHFTASSTGRSAFETWKKAANRISAPYIVELDGTIRETYDPRCWSYHLGVRGAASRSWANDKRSIAIELVNVGPLRFRDGRLYWWPGDYGARYCDASESGRYGRMSYRGADYFALFPEPQYRALGELLAWLCSSFGIARKVAPEERRSAIDAEWFGGFQGIAGHFNFRSDKFDPGPAIDWKRIS